MKYVIVIIQSQIEARLKQHQSHEFKWKVIHTARSFFKRKILEGHFIQQNIHHSINKFNLTHFSQLRIVIHVLQTCSQREYLEKQLKIRLNKQLSLKTSKSKTFGFIFFQTVSSFKFINSRNYYGNKIVVT